MKTTKINKFESFFPKLIISALFLRSRTLAEETACLEQYGDSYRAYMKRVPRYLLIKTCMKEEGENKLEK